MQRFVGRTVFISGIARGQGRSHAVRFAGEGANIIGFDRCADMPGFNYPLATEEDLGETVRLVETQGVRMHAAVADVRDAAAVADVLHRGSEMVGSPTVVIANAGVTAPKQLSWEIPEQTFHDVVATNLTGVWNTLRPAVDSLLDRNEKGCCLVTGSGASVKAIPNIGAYVAAKHGLLGLMRVMAKELGPFGIRVNAVLPGNTHTAMFDNEAMRQALTHGDDPTGDLFLERARANSPMGLPWVEPEDVSDAMLFLASDAAKHLTGVVLPVDGGTAIP